MNEFKKLFMYSDGTLEEVQISNLKGYGVAYSHPKHLNTFYGTNIKSFKDMDKVLDDKELIRVSYDSYKGYKYNVGNKATKEQLKLIRLIFKENRKLVGVGVTSISRKYHKSYNAFIKALQQKNQEIEDPDNKQFKTHVGILAQ